MIVILRSGVEEGSPEFRRVMDYLDARPGIRTRLHREIGTLQTLIEIYLIGDTKALNRREIEGLAAVERVVQVSEEYRIIGRHRDDRRPSGFQYNGVVSISTTCMSSPDCVP